MRFWKQFTEWLGPIIEDDPDPQYSRLDRLDGLNTRRPGKDQLEGLDALADPPQGDLATVGGMPYECGCHGCHTARENFEHLDEDYPA